MMELVVSNEDWGEMDQPFLLPNKSREVIISLHGGGAGGRRQQRQMIGHSIGS